MTRDVNLVEYLPPFLTEFKETKSTLEAENPEFTLIWNAANGVLLNEFIETADDYGLSRYEKILNILPSSEDTLESRRSKIQSKWLSTIPYTLKEFIKKLEVLCSNNNFTISKDYDHYKLVLEINLELFGQIDELEYIINTMIPCNMIVEANNKVICSAEGDALTIGGVCFTETLFITNDWQEKENIQSEAAHAGGVISTEKIIAISD